MRKTFNKLVCDNGILYGQVKTDDKERRQLVITESIVPHVLHSLHNDLGHPGRDKTMVLARDRFLAYICKIVPSFKQKKTTLSLTGMD